MKSILIYQDYVYNNGSLYKALSRFFGPDTIGFADADDLSMGILTAEIKAFFMPGGASRYVADKLQGTGNAAIKNWVAAGGCYIGICAGAYYACAETVWKRGEPDEIIVKNELALCSASAVGPVAEWSMDDKMAQIVMLADANGKENVVFYWGGPLFGNAGNVEVEKLYVDLPGKPAAIISGRYGDGRYILSSPHIEIDSGQLDLMRFTVSDNRYEDIARLGDTSAITTNVFTNILKRYFR